jgi:2'-5' RNA ligase
VSRRLFVAVEVNDAVHDLARRAAAALEDAGLCGLRFEPSEKLHCTLAFLGATRQEQLEDITRSLHEAASRVKPFRIVFDVLGAFPNPSRPRVIWLGSRALNRAFAECAREVRDACAALGYTFDNDPHPHVTICRIKDRRPVALPPLPGTAGLEVVRLTLMESLPAGQTTRYEAIECIALA